jgi:hypothetical protein
VRSIALGFLIAVALVDGTCAAGAPEHAPGPQASLTLSDEHPEVSFPIDSQTVSAAPAVLELKVPSVFNPARLGFHLLVYLTFDFVAVKNKREKVLIGDAGFYPADRPAGFQMRSSKAFAKLKAAGSKATDVRLLLEIRRIHDAESWKPVKVTIAPPQWKTKAPGEGF